MRRYAAPAVLAGAFSFLLSCNPLLGSLPSGMVNAAMVQQVPYSGTFQYTVDPGSTPRDVYFVFTNPSLTQDAASIPTVSGSISVDGKGVPAPASQPLASTNSAPQTTADWISEFNRNPKAYITPPSITGPSAQTVSPAGGDTANVSTGSFWIANPNGTNTVVTVNATCRYVVPLVTFADGRTRTLSIWVENNSWNTAETTLAMVTALANRFLQKPESISPGDIYHWDTSVVGEPWGPQDDPNLIAWDAKNTVTILLTHLNASYSGAVAVGYFWAKDNFPSSAISYSNQRIMFYLDSYLYSTVLAGPPYNESGWAATNYWPKIVFSTLAHEFQHMIQFYQKQVLRGAGSNATGTDTWINEMCSMLMEDLVADKLNVEGPRGVTPWSDGSAGTPGTVDNSSSRIPGFNASSNASLAVTGSGFGLTQYSVAYAFGAWLIRNYGGPALLTRIVQSPQTDYTAVVIAAAAYSGRTETMEGLLQKWAASVLISDNTSAPFGYRYNTGAWMSFSEGSLTFSLGSLNVFNYSPTLTVYSGSTAIPAAPYYSSNIYYLAASQLAGARTFTVTIPAGTGMSVVLK